MQHHGRLSSHYREAAFATAQQSVKTSIPQPANPFSPATICALLLPADAVALIASAAVSYGIWLFENPYAIWTEYAPIVAFGTLLTINIFYLARLYHRDILKRPRATVRRAAGWWFVAAAVLIAMGFLTKTSDDYSRIWAALWFSIGLATMIGLRIAFFVQAARWTAQGKLHNNVAIVGKGASADRLIDHFTSKPLGGIRIAGVFTDESLPHARQYGRGGIDGTVEDLLARIRRNTVDTVVLALPLHSTRRVKRVLERLSEFPVDVRLCLGGAATSLEHRGICDYAGVPMLNLANRPLADWRYAAKEIEDRVLGTLILAMISPIMLAIAALIKLDSAGPVFFRQKRYGYNDQLIEVLKFRTMRHDQEDRRAERLTARDDPRVTRIGRYLRKWSLDELPQFINVVRGEMSIVGPRPHALSAKASGTLYQKAVPHYSARHRVKPGITGWAQINGWRGPTDTLRQIQMRVAHDLHYIENWSVWLDLRIILLTIFKGFSGRNAF